MKSFEIKTVMISTKLKEKTIIFFQGVVNFTQKKIGFFRKRYRTMYSINDIGHFRL